MLDQSILVYDIETNGLDVDESKCVYFGSYSYEDDKFYLTSNMQEIKALIQRHRTLIGFNNREFDNMILCNQHKINFNHKNIIDLYEVSKKRLANMGINLPNLKLKTIIDHLKLCKQSKGEFDYKIFQKEEWTKKEIEVINKYTKQDIVMTKALFMWFFEQFKPLREFLNEEDKENFIDVKASLASLSYKVICNMAGLKCEFKHKNKVVTRAQIPGGHHIEPRTKKVKGNIVCIDFVSAYPHAMMMGNLFSQNSDGWDGKPFFNLNGIYEDKKFGKVEKALQTIFLERLKAKKLGDKVKAQAYKIVINALYGLTGNAAFKTLYNPTTAQDCTSMARTWLKKLAKTLDVNGYEILYGYTDSVYVKIPEQSNKDELMYIVDKYIEEVKSNVPFPQDTFKLEVEKEYKFIWFIEKNCYLWVDKDNEVGYRSTLLNSNTPKVILNVFDNYIAPKIKNELDVNFKVDELEKQLKNELEKDISLACVENNVKSKNEYNSKTTSQYQISEMYGEGKHLLIPNLMGVGVGKDKSTKKRIGVRHCTLQEFKDNGFTIQDIDVSKLLSHLKRFYKQEGKL